MWNEHCSYKSSKKWLKTLPITGDRVIQGPGENAGVVDIGDGQAIVFKMESHNHPSFIEPYQGAGTGVGGILRDVFTMGARPIAALNALRFGAPGASQDPSPCVRRCRRHWAVMAIASALPTVGGEVNFHERYNGNILVNAMAVGLADTDKIFYSEAKGVGLPVVYLGAKTGRDGIHGATMASAEFDDSIEEKRPTVQVGDPFTEKCLLEACMELNGVRCRHRHSGYGRCRAYLFAVEMGAKGGLGVELNLNAVPCREDGMTPYEMMLSESQERMLMVLRPEQEKQAEANFPQVGDWTSPLSARPPMICASAGLWNGEEVANLPIRDLGDEAPEYDRPLD